MEITMKKGLVGEFLNVIGYGALIFVLISGFIDASTVAGGTVNLVNQTITDPVVREDVMKYQAASFFLTPMIQVGEWYITVDALGTIIVLFFSLGVAWVINLFLEPGMVYLIPITVIGFLVFGALWQGIWVNTYVDSGMKLGISEDQLIENLKDTSHMFTTPFLLIVTLISSFFVLSKTYTILPGL